jgi:hypothetical protein
MLYIREQVAHVFRCRLQADSAWFKVYKAGRPPLVRGVVVLYIYIYIHGALLLFFLFFDIKNYT